MMNLGKQAKSPLVLALLIVLLTACSNLGQGSEAAVNSPSDVATTAPANAVPGEAVPANGQKLNLNTVSGDELLSTIPGFGNRMVREFEEYRPYISIQQFRREIGKYVDEAQVATYEQYVYVPIDVNESDAETIMQIPGVDVVVADTLIAVRPFASNAAFLDSLADIVPEIDREMAASYLESP